jgi:excinuclease ABC subunit A
MARGKARTQRSEIVIRGAREHNLRDVSLTLPKNKLIVMTGVSGSGKSSLAFDTLYAEGQRRYVESLSSYARQFLGQMPKPEVDSITGLAPSISIQQKTRGRNPRSTVGTITEIYDYLRVLFARVGQQNCYQCGRPITAQSVEQIIDAISQLEAGTKFQILAPVVQGQKGEYRDLAEDLLKQGYVRARVDGQIVQLSEDLHLDKQMRHNIEVVVDRLVAGKASRTRLTEAVEQALRLGNGLLIYSVEEPKSRAAEGREQRDEGDESHHDTPRPSALASQPSGDTQLSSDYACTHCGISFEAPSPQLFSFNSPQGMCLDCNGLGQRFEFIIENLVEDQKKSLWNGAVPLLGAVKSIGRWRKHIYKGVAEAIETDLGLDRDAFLKTPWRDLDPAAIQLFLYGLGDRHITFSYGHRGGTWKHGGTFDGFVPELLDGYRKTNNPMRRKQLEKYMRFVSCSTCDGNRLNRQATAVTLTSNSDFYLKSGVRGKKREASLNLAQVCGLDILSASAFFESLELDEKRRFIAEEAVKEVRGRLGFLLRCGLNYLTLNRTAPTLSGGESQRIRLAGQIGCGLVDVVYILDEPSIGLHPRDNKMLLESLCDLRDQGNTVIVVEHDEETMLAADHVIDFGPGPGVRGGEIVAEGSVADVKKAKRSLTGQYLSGRKQIEVPKKRRPIGEDRITIRGATHHNLKSVDVEFPLGTFICVTGVSGSGKSSLINDILWQSLNRDVNGGNGSPGDHEEISGLDLLDKAIDIDQSAIGRTPRSNPATYVKLADLIRDLYSKLPDSKVRGYKPGRFSFNVPGGRCEACEGHGANKLEMDFLADIWVRCPVCQGKRFSHETLEVRFKGRNIAEVLNMDVQEALDHFVNVPKIHRLLKTLHDVGLDYLKLGQPSPTLSGGEAQRIKLARELGKRSTGQTIYILDEPTTGLHFADVEKLLEVLHGFVDAGNTVLVVEHNLDVIKTADWVIDLGPEGGSGGGKIIKAGTPEEIARAAASHTGEALSELLKIKRRKSARKVVDQQAALAPLLRMGNEASEVGGGSKKNGIPKSITIRGASQHNLQNVDLEIPREQMNVFCGPSGSGKTSLAMDTLYAEGQRRYVESLSAYARQFLGQMPKPRVEHIHGLQPSVAIEQKSVGSTPRSTIGTVTEIYDYLRILWCRLGTQNCPECQTPVQTQTTDEVIDRLLALDEGSKLLLLAPQEVRVGQVYERLWENLREQGFSRVRINGETHRLEDVPDINRKRKHNVEIVVDRVTINPKRRSRIADSVEAALDLGHGVMRVAHVDDRDETDWKVEAFSLFRACETCGRSFEELTPNNFSYNSPLGWCPECEGIGTQQGTDLAVLISDPQRTLEEAAVAVWPDPRTSQVFAAMLRAMADELGMKLDVPFAQLDPVHRRAVLYGTGERWFSVKAERRGARDEGTKLRTTPTSLSPRPFAFQYKGLFPALEEASRVSYQYRRHLSELVGDVPCSSCDGSRLRDDSANIRFQNTSLQQVCEMPLDQALAFLKKIRLKGNDKRVAGDLLEEATGRLSFLVEVGLEYLTLSRPLPTLSGGETQRIRLAGQIGRALTGICYVLDEPTIGLHPRDNTRLIGALARLRDLGNTLVLVEHDREVIASADRVFDFGPGAGRFGGTITEEGTPKQVAKRAKSLTGEFLGGKRQILIPSNRRISSLTEHDAQLERTREGEVPVEPQTQRAFGKATKRRKKSAKKKAEKKVALTARQEPRPPLRAVSEFRGPYLIGTPSMPIPPGNGWLELVGARLHNLRNVDLRIPLGTLTVVTGVSGSGKSSLIEDTLAKALVKIIHRANDQPGPYDKLLGLNLIDKAIVVDQNPLGSTPKSNPGTYTGVFDHIRELFARLPDAKVRGYRPGRFSFNRPGGRCDACEGDGQKKIEMHFLPDVWVECDDCRGQRYNSETLSVKYRGQSIADVLQSSIGQCLSLFENIPKIRRSLSTLCAIGLDYLTLGQSATTLSGGEAQRVKLAAELARPNTGKTIYLLDEPTTGLHFDDIDKLLKVLNSLVELGNTVVIIEHNLDVIKTADWVIDIGPEAGIGGGWIVAEGTPEDVVSHAEAFQSGTTWPNSVPSGTLSPEGRGDGIGELLRSHTGEQLAAILSGKRGDRDVFDAKEEGKKREGDLTMADVGREAKMPWETDGPRWHLQDRIAHSGNPCQWEGSALESIVEKLEQFQTEATEPAAKRRRKGTKKKTARRKAIKGIVRGSDLLEAKSGEGDEPDSQMKLAVNWNDPSTVEVTGEDKKLGWFLHALTRDEWLLKLYFRVDKKTFDQVDLEQRLKLKHVDDIDELAVYGRGERVRVKNSRGPFQEVLVTVHWLREIDTPEFWQFLREARDSYLRRVESASTDVKDVSPWKVLGRKWHLMRKGFPANKQARWKAETLEALFELMAKLAPSEKVVWNERQFVRYRFAKGKKDWAVVRTKSRTHIELTVMPESGEIGTGEIADVASECEVFEAKDGRSGVRLKFRNLEQIQSPKLTTFLKQCRTK